jgi:hypothetical protein
MVMVIPWLVIVISFEIVIFRFGLAMNPNRTAALYPSIFTLELDFLAVKFAAVAAITALELVIPAAGPATARSMAVVMSAAMFAMSPFLLALP